MQTDAPLDFTNINYLREGTPRQKEVYHLLQSHAILERLHQYQPLLIGSIPIGVDIPDSDIDISCGYQHLEDFRTTLLQLFSGEDQFQLRQRHFNGFPTLIANFHIPPFPIEIFGQPIPPAKQYGYRHMMTENKWPQHRSGLLPAARTTRRPIHQPPGTGSHKMIV